MLEKLILLLDTRKEMRTKYKRHLQASDVKVVVKSSIKDAVELITILQPDLIMISDSVGESLSENISHLRLLTYNFRPEIIALSKSSHLQDKLDALNSGADDFFEEPVLKEELIARVNAHLRRLLESEINVHTGLYNAKISYKTLNRLMINTAEWSVLLVGINNFAEYKIVYGELAAEKMLQTYVAIITSALDDEDYLGQIAYDDFIIITNSLKAEKIAAYLTHAFDLIAQRFYNDTDLKQGYIILSDDDTEEKPVPIVTTSIAMISNEFKKYKNMHELMTDLLVLHKVVRSRVGSNYLMDRPKIGGENTVVEPVYNNKVMVIEEDESLSLLLESNFIMRNYKVKSISSYEKLNLVDIVKFNPALIVLDAGEDKTFKGLEFCKQQLTKSKKIKSKIILTTTMHNKTEVLNTGVDLYLPKPYKIQSLMNWAEKLLKEFNQ